MGHQSLTCKRMKVWSPDFSTPDMAIIEEEHHTLHDLNTTAKLLKKVLLLISCKKRNLYLRWIDQSEFVSVAHLHAQSQRISQLAQRRSLSPHKSGNWLPMSRICLESNEKKKMIFCHFYDKSRTMVICFQKMLQHRSESPHKSQNFARVKSRNASVQ